MQGKGRHDPCVVPRAVPSGAMASGTCRLLSNGAYKFYHWRFHQF